MATPFGFCAQSHHLALQGLSHVDLLAKRRAVSSNCPTGGAVARGVRTPWNIFGSA